MSGIMNNKFKELLLPTIFIAMALNITAIVDSIFVSSFIGPSALAALELLEPIVLFVTVIEWLFGLGGQVMSLNCKGEFDEEMKDFKFTLISSDLSNYFFYDIKSEKGNGDKLLLNLESYEGLEDIKIDELADIECTDNSFLELTGKGFITLVDNSLNKITIIDLIQDN